MSFVPAVEEEPPSVSPLPFYTSGLDAQFTLINGMYHPNIKMQVREMQLLLYCDVLQIGTVVRLSRRSTSSQTKSSSGINTRTRLHFSAGWQDLSLQNGTGVRGCIAAVPCLPGSEARLCSAPDNASLVPRKLLP